MANVRPARIMEYWEDLIPVSLIIGVVTIQLLLYFSSWSPLAILAVVVPLQAVQQISRAIMHYHHHRNVFRIAALNRIYEVMLFFCTGLSPQQFTLHHVLGHHTMYLDPTTDVLRWKRPDGTRMTDAEFVIKGVIGLYKYPFLLGPKYPTIYARFKRWLVISLLLLTALVVHNPVNALIIYVGPMTFLLFDIIRLNFWDHVGVEGTDHYNGSRNTLSWAYNFFTFNSGYHTAHHVEPALHWSKVKALHERIADRIPPELNEGLGQVALFIPPKR